MKKLLSFCCAIAIMCVSLPIGSASANGSSNLSLVDSKSYELNGEQFEVRTWKDSDGTKIYTVPTEVRNKTEVADFVGNLIKGEQKPEITPFGVGFNWSRELEGYDLTAPDKAKILWRASGYSSVGPVGSYNYSEMGVNQSELKAFYLPTGYPDKMYLSYSTTYNGISASVTFSDKPSITFSPSTNTITWKSDPMSGDWLIVTSSDPSHATSYIGITSTAIQANTEIYMGKNVYKAQVSEKIGYLNN